MPVEFKSLDHGMGILFKGKGLLTGKELIDALSEIYRLEENTKEVKYVIEKIRKFYVLNYLLLT